LRQSGSRAETLIATDMVANKREKAMDKKTSLYKEYLEKGPDSLPHSDMKRALAFRDANPEKRRAG
jgi:hypothetical protein